MNKQNTYFLMIGSSNKRQPFQYKGSKGNLGLQGVLEDFKLFTNNLGAKSYSFDFLQSSSHNKGQLKDMDSIKIWLQNKFGQKEKYIVLFYSGHGLQNTGNLSIDTTEKPGGHEFGLDQLVKIWRRKRGNRLNQSRLFVFLDSCYSGNWCYNLPNFKQPSIGIFSVCHQNQKARDTSMGGSFFNCIFGDSNNFKENFDKLVFHHSPKFINKSEKPSNLKRSDLKAINSDIFKIETLLSSQQSGDLYQLIEGKNNNGSIYFKSGQLYHGTWNNLGEPQGYGKYIYNTGQQFQGQWLEGLFHGNGQFKMLGGYSYVGKWVKGQLNGQGTLKLNLTEKILPDQPNQKQITIIQGQKKMQYKNGKLFKQEEYVLKYDKKIISQN